MDFFILLLFAALFAAFAALVFALLTLGLGTAFESFEVSGPDDGSFFDFYKRYLIVSAVFTFVSLPLGNGLIGLAALAMAYKFVFDAGWVQALVMGTIGGVIAIVLFLILITLVLTPLGLLAA